jgi:hypothetical protein
MTYYVYENWTAENKAVIHRSSCGNCKEGEGCHRNPLGDRNGRWHGPYGSIEEAERKAIETGRPVRKHRCI